MAFAPRQSRADEIDAARHRSFDLIAPDDVSAAYMSMSDPQQPAYGAEESPLVLSGTAQRIPVMVEAPSFPNFERAAPQGDLAGPLAPVAPAPEQVAREIVAEARLTARTMLAQARDVIAADRAAAVEQGHAEGFARGQAEADAETAGLVSTCEKIGVHVMEERERVLADSEADVVELAIAIARRIVNAAIDVDETLVVEACRGAMRKAFQRGSMQVLAHPDDLALLRAAGPELANELGGVEHLDFIEERRLDRGSVVVRTPAGEIDATIAGKADKIELSLREGIEQRRAERRAAN